MSESPLITLEQVERRYANGVLALDGLSLAVPRRAFISLLGPSGCGKSTVLRLLAGLDPPSAGRLHRQADARDIGYVFQEPTLMPWACVLDNVALPLRLAQWPRERREAAARQALAAVGLAEFAAAMPRELSGGMQMRASIARALVTRPALLLLDEPFAALDEISRFRLNQELLALWQAPEAGDDRDRDRDSGRTSTGDGAAAGPGGFTAVFVTHSVYEAVFLSQQVIVMSARPGRIVERIDIDASYPRDAGFRDTAAFNALCSRVSRALRRAGGEALPAVDG